LVKKLSFLIYKIIYFINFLFFKITKRSILVWFSEFIENDSYKSIKILNKKVNFFVPNYITNYLIDTFFTKEPETLEWIDNFDENKKVIFWDIGANIGLYSIYATLKHPAIEVICFEPSTSNLRILSRNISINKLEEKIKINQFPLTNKANQYQILREKDFIEGVGENAFGVDYNWQGKNFESNNNYQIYGTSIDYLIKNKILKMPNYIKIDVDGIEHLILEGGIECLSSPELKSICVEINDNLPTQDKIIKLMNKYNFKTKHKKVSKLVSSVKKFSTLYNYVFEK
jgi:FkbM family methyltransferase